MSDREITVTNEWGAIRATYQDNADMTHRLWGDRTDDGRFVALAEVLEYASGARHFCNEVAVPDDVEQALIEYCGLDDADDIVLRQEVY